MFKTTRLTLKLEDLWWTYLTWTVRQQSVQLLLNLVPFLYAAQSNWEFFFWRTRCQQTCPQKSTGSDIVRKKTQPKPFFIFSDITSVNSRRKLFFLAPTFFQIKEIHLLLVWIHCRKLFKKNRNTSVEVDVPILEDIIFQYEKMSKISISSCSVKL